MSIAKRAAQALRKAQRTPEEENQNNGDSGPFGEFHHWDLATWKEEAKRRGYEIEPGGDGSLIAHVDGDEKGQYKNGMGTLFDN